MLALINVAAICNIKNFPLMAEYGLASVFFLVLGALLFFIPVSLVSAELATGWPDRGIYTWVKEGIGPKWGFIAVWLQWIENVIWYPTVLSFIASTSAYLFDPALAENKFYVVAVVFVAYWAMTFVNFFGIRASGWISSLSVSLGTILPMVLIAALGIFYLAGPAKSVIAFTTKAFFPSLTSINELVLFTGFILGYAGMEMSAVHARDVENPGRDYPRAIFLSAALIIILSAAGSLVIATVVPARELQLTSGGMEAFRSLFEQMGIGWATPLIAAVMTFGALGMMSTWIVGPSRGLFASALEGDLPAICRKVNRHDMPVPILIIQGVIVTALSLVFLFMPTVGSSYWILVALAAIVYMGMYVLMFIAAIRLRYTHGHVPRQYKIPFGLPGIWIVSSIGILGSSLAFVIGFFPPSQIDTGDIFYSEIFLIGGTLLFFLLPVWLYKRFP
jgi:amino acid transporter